MPARVVVLGGGVGGTLTANLLDKELGHDVEVTVVDPTGMHDYQPGYLYVALGEAKGHWLSRDERTLLRRDVDLADRAGGPDRSGCRHRATRARRQPPVGLPRRRDRRAPGPRGRCPGLVEGSFEFYSLPGAERLSQELHRFTGRRIKVGVAGIPYKCPPAPVEFTFMVDGFLRERGLRDRERGRAPARR